MKKFVLLIMLISCFAFPLLAKGTAVVSATLPPNTPSQRYLLSDEDTLEAVSVKVEKKEGGLVHAIVTVKNNTIWDIDAFNIAIRYEDTYCDLITEYGIRKGDTMMSYSFSDFCLKPEQEVNCVLISRNFKGVKRVHVAIYKYHLYEGQTVDALPFETMWDWIKSE